MKREDFVFTVGFDGNKAIVDKHSRRKYGQLDTRALADKKLFKAACRSAIYSDDQQDMRYVMESFNTSALKPCKDISDMIKLFGTHPPTDDIAGIRLI